MILGMYETFNSHPRNVGDLLSGNERARIMVPRFQRGYSWERKHVESFWNDLCQFAKDSGDKDGPTKYFLGPIVILVKSKDEIAILDGQQRLATATILFCVLRDLGRKIADQPGADFARDIQRELVEKENVGFALEMGDSDKKFFAETIQRDPPVSMAPSLRSHLNIERARAYLHDAIEKKISDLSKSDALAYLRSLRQIVRSDLIMACIPVQQERDAFKIFETLNDRGLRLSVPDLLLNYLMGAAKEKERIAIRSSWDDILELMGKRDINRFLRHWWVSKFGDLKNQDLFTALKKRIQDDAMSSKDFITMCESECEKYVSLLDQNKEEIGEEAAALVASILRKLDVQAAFPVLLSTIVCIPGHIEEVARVVLVFVVRYSVIGGQDMSGLENILFALARQIRTMAESKKKGKDCVAYIKKTLMDASPTDEQLKVSLPSLVLTAEEARYLIPTLARHLQSKTKEVTIHEANLEHIFPKKPSDEWTKQQQADLRPLLWHIGNLTMLGERLNHTSANGGFAKKKPLYESKSELEISRRIAKEYKQWTSDSIKRRANGMFGDVSEIWNFDNPSRV